MKSLTTNIVAPALVFLLVVLAASADVAAQKPMIEQSVFNDHAMPPSSPIEMARAVDAIVLGKYTGETRLIEHSFSARDVLRSTAHIFEVIDVIKAAPFLPNVGDRFEVVLIGGYKEFPKHVLHAKLADADELQAEATYAIFLRWNQRRNEFRLAWEQDGLYNVTNATVRGVGRGRPQQDRQSVPAFLNALRAVH